MKTVREASKGSGIPESLIQAVIDQLGDLDSLEGTLADIRNHGVDGGFPGFTYTSDCVEFFVAHRADIVALVKQMADDTGEPALEMVCCFNCLGGHVRNAGEKASAHIRKAVLEYSESVGRCIYGAPLTDDDDQVANALAWFAAEEVARAFEDC